MLILGEGARGRPKKVEEPVEKKKNYIFTFTGRKFYYDEFKPEQFDIEDIAHAASLINRFGGHTTRAYPLAKHCIISCQIAPDEFKLEALLHDAVEAVIGDCPTGLKHGMPGVMDGYREYEKKQEEQLVKRFKLQGIKPGELVDIDRDLAYLEALAWLNFDHRSWKEPDGIKERMRRYHKRWPTFVSDIHNYWPPEGTKQMFLNFYNKYKKV